MDNTQHIVYILRCNDDTLYCGYTTNIKNRIDKHSTGKGAKYTRHRTPLVLVYVEYFPCKSDALKREHCIKSLTRTEKLNLINSDINKI
jgi:putative endonuclease